MIKFMFEFVSLDIVIVYVGFFNKCFFLFNIDLRIVFVFFKFVL